MTGSNRRRLATFALVVAFVPTGAHAQTVARSFQELLGILKTDEVVVVVDKTGKETWGKVAELSVSSLGLIILEQRRVGETVTTGVKRTFAGDTVAELIRSDLFQTKGLRIYPASWEKVLALQPDTVITVFLDTGERRNYYFRRAAENDLLVTASGQEQLIQKSSVTRVLAKHNDPMGNGIGYGALVGAVAGWGAFRLQGALCGQGCEEGTGEFPSAVFGAGIGALVGFLIDKSRKGTEMLFPVASGSVDPSSKKDNARSVVGVSPIVSTKRRGLGISLRF